MQPFTYHVFACDQTKAEGAPCCHARQSTQMIDALRRELGARGLLDRVQLTVCGSLGLCESGPNLVVYPEGTWYSGVRPEDVAELVESHFQNGVPLGRLRRADEAATRVEISVNRDRAMAAMRVRATDTPDWLNDLLRGFQPSRALFTALELDVYTSIGDRSVSAEEIARELGTNARATESLLNVLVSLDTLAKKDGLYSQLPVSRFLAGRDRLALLHMANLTNTWQTLTDCVRTGTCVSREFPPAGGVPFTESFIAAMDRRAAQRVSAVTAAADPSSVRRLLDVGGGSGAYSIAFATANPGLHAVVLDLPDVLPITQRHINAAGLADRIRTVPGDLSKDEFEFGFDLALLSQICHMLHETEVQDLFRRCRKALVHGGRLIVQEFLLEGDKTKPRSAALFSLNMLVNTDRGASYSVQEYSKWLIEAGFVEVRHVRSPGPAGLLIATAAAQAYQ